MTFCPTMMMGRRTRCRKFDESQLTSTVGEPCSIAAGKASSAMSVKTEAQYIVPTILVILTATAALKRPMTLVPWTWAKTCVACTSLGLCSRGAFLTVDIAASWVPVLAVICVPPVSSLPRPVQLDPPALVGVRRIVVSEVDESALLVPDVLAVHDHRIAGRDGDAPADAHVVVDQEGLCRGRQPHDKALMRPRGAALVGEHTCDAALRGDLDLRPVLREGALDRRVVRRRRRAPGRDDQGE